MHLPTPSLLHVIASVQLVSDVFAMLLPSHEGVVPVSDVIKSRANGNNQYINRRAFWRHLSVTESVSWSYTLVAASPVALLIWPTMLSPATHSPPGSHRDDNDNDDSDNDDDNDNDNDEICRSHSPAAPG